MASWRLARRVAPTTLAVALVVALTPTSALAAGTDVTGGRPGETAAPQPAPPATKVHKTSVPAVEPKGGSDTVVAQLPESSTKDFRMVGVTWAEGADDVAVQVRTRTDGAWSGWTDLENDDDETGETGGRPGTEPLWVGEADGVAARVSSKTGTPQDVSIVTIDPGQDGGADATGALYSGPGDGTARATATADGSPTYTAKPTVITRAQWGAGPGTSCSSPTVGSTTRGVIVHHTAGSNSYAASDSKALVRGIQAYHTKGHGWCDIGYNFLVDKYGQIFEGRKGGMDHQVRAAHSGNNAVNTYDMGVSMMANLDKVRPSAAMQSSMVKLIGWRMGTTYLPAKGTYSLGGLKLNMIAGHRNVVGTGCPGKYGYEWLTQSGGLRDRVASYLASYSTPSKTLAKQLGSTRTGAVYVGENVASAGHRTRFSKLDIYWSAATGARAVSDYVRTEYNRVGNQSGALGFPSGNYVSKASSTGYQRFAKGTVFRVGSKAYTVTNPIGQAYYRLGEMTGKLGAPTRSVYTEKSGVTRASFAKGYIRYTSSTRKTVAYSSSGAVLSTTTTTTTPSAGTTAPSANTLTVPSSRTFTLRGHGYGHGIGMGQYGAKNAAQQGVRFGYILGYYYPGTTWGTRTGSIRVSLSKATSSVVTVAGQPGLKLRRPNNKLNTLPDTAGGKTVKQWRIAPWTSDKKQSVLQYVTTGGWTTFNTSRWVGDAQFEAAKVRLYLPDGSTATYRERVRSTVPSTGSTSRKTVNVLSIENYLRGVVSAEMPSSWHTEALKAQAVAARTYAVRSMSATRYYDVCDTTSCQVYRGTAGETSATDAAISYTATRILMSGGKPALTQFSSSTGGWSAPGGASYLKLQADKYDNFSGNPNHSWSKAISASSVEKAYPTIGTLKTLTISKRVGLGDWGGRVTTVQLVGSKGTKSVSGADLRFALGLKSAWFRFN